MQRVLSVLRDVRHGFMGMLVKQQKVHINRHSKGEPFEDLKRQDVIVFGNFSSVHLFDLIVEQVNTLV